jgi:hypothetical protein
MITACRRRPVGLLVIAATVVAACGESTPPDGEFRPTEPRLLSALSPAKDEDPSVLRAADGTLLVAWFSERSGNPDLWITSTRNGADWTDPVRVTTAPGGDFNPHLIQDDAGVFHLVWFRWSAPFRGNIWSNSSTDGVTWDPGAEVQVTRMFDVDDWVPTLAQAADGSLLVYFVSELRDSANSTNEIYRSRRPPGAGEWDPVAALPGINSPTAHDHLPFAARVGDDIRLVWVRFDTTQAIPWLNPESDLYTATSADGITWSTPVRLTDEPGAVVNLYPKLYADAAGAWSYLWLSTRSGAARPFERDVVEPGGSPQGVRPRDELPDGYSHSIVATSTPGIYLGVWVQGPEGSQDLWYRFFER